MLYSIMHLLCICLSYGIVCVCVFFYYISFCSSCEYENYLIVRVTKTHTTTTSSSSFDEAVGILVERSLIKEEESLLPLLVLNIFSFVATFNIFFKS